MALYKNNDIRRKTIMKHYLNAKFKVKTITNKDIELASKYCVDKLELKLEWNDDKVINAQFAGIGCAIFLSSVDIFLEKIQGKTKKEIKELLQEYSNMIYQNGEYHLEKIGKLGVYENVAIHLNRLHCAEMIKIALEKVING